MAESPPPDSEAAPGPRPRALLVLLALAATVGIVVSLAAWCFLELIHQMQVFVFTDLPNDLGYDHGPPSWWYIVVLGIAGLLVALAITRLPGNGGHVAAEGLKVGGAPTEPIELPGIILAGLATIGLGLVLGPEAPLIALGAGLGLLAIRFIRRDTPAQVQAVIAGSGSFAAMAMIFSSPIIAAVILIEAMGLDREKLPKVLVPGLLAAGIGSLTSIGMGSLTGLSTSAYTLSPLSVPELAEPTLAEFAWTIPLAVAVAGLGFIILRIGLQVHRLVIRRQLLLVAAAGVLVAGLAIAFHGVSGKSVDQVLFSGQDALPELVTESGSWSISALLLLLAFKGLAWSVSLGSFRGGPTFPALFIGAAAGLLASHLPGFAETGAIGVGMGAGIVSVLRLPLAAVVLATLLVSEGGAGTGPLIIVGVVVAYLATVALDRAFGPGSEEGDQGAAGPSAPGEAVAEGAG